MNYTSLLIFFLSFHYLSYSSEYIKKHTPCIFTTSVMIATGIVASYYLSSFSRQITTLIDQQKKCIDTLQSLNKSIVLLQKSAHVVCGHEHHATEMIQSLQSCSQAITTLHSDLLRVHALVEGNGRMPRGGLLRSRSTTKQ